MLCKFATECLRAERVVKQIHSHTRSGTLGQNFTQRFRYVAFTGVIHLDGDRDLRRLQVIPEPWEHAAVESELHGVSSHDWRAGEERYGDWKIVLVRPER